MGRGSRDDRQARRAAELLERALKRGLAADAAEAWRSLGEDVRTAALPDVQALIAKACDEAQRTRSRDKLVVLLPHVDKAPELVDGRAGEPPGATRERWWLFMWAAGLARDATRARRAWGKIEEQTRAEAPPLAEAIASWLDGTLEPRHLDALDSLLTPDGVEHEPDPRLGFEPIATRDGTPPPANAGEVETRVLATLAERRLHLAVARLREWITGPAKEHARAIAELALPLLLRDALARHTGVTVGDAAEALRLCFDVAELAPPNADIEPTITTAVRWVLASTHGRDMVSRKLSALIGRAVALAFRYPALVEPVRHALLGLPFDHLEPVARYALCERLLSIRGVDPRLWLRIAGTTTGKDAPKSFWDTLTHTFADAWRDPSTAVTVLEGSDAKVRAQALSFAADMVPIDRVEGLIDACWERASDMLRADLGVVVQALLERADQESAMAGRRKVAGSGLARDIADDVFAMRDDGASEEEVIEEILADAPRELPRSERAMIERIVRDAIASYTPPARSARSAALWSRVGLRALPYQPALLDEALARATSRADKQRLVLTTLERVTRLESWLQRGHEVFRHHDKALGFGVLDAAATRFGGGLAECARAFAWADEGGCRCGYTEAIVERFLVAVGGASAADVAPHAGLVSRARRGFPGIAREVDRAMRGRRAEAAGGKPKTQSGAPKSAKSKAAKPKSGKPETPKAKQPATKKPASGTRGKVDAREAGQLSLEDLVPGKRR